MDLSFCGRVEAGEEGCFGDGFELGGIEFGASAESDLAGGGAVPEGGGFRSAGVGGGQNERGIEMVGAGGDFDFDAACGVALLANGAGEIAGGGERGDGVLLIVRDGVDVDDGGGRRG